MRELGARPGLAAVLLLLLFATSLILCFGTPPFWVGDEPAHFQRTESISRGAMLPQLGVDARGRVAAGGPISVSYRSFSAAVQSGNPLAGLRPVAKSRVEAARTVPEEARTEFGAFSNTAIYPPLLYAPAAAAVGVARAVHAPMLYAFYAGRVANAVTFFVILLIAIRYAGEARYFVVCCAAVPILLFDTASFSADAVLLPVVITFSAWLATTNASEDRSSAAGLGVAGLVIAVGKVAYMPLAFLPPVLAFVEDRQLSRRFVTLLAMASVAVTLWAAWAFVVHDKVISIRDDVSIDPAAQLRWVLHHPRWYTHIAWQQVKGDWSEILPRVFGYRLGWGNVPAPVWLSWTSAIAIIVSASAMGKRRSAPVGTIIVYATVSVCGLAVILLLYLQFNAVGANVLLGIQGRYFLPLVIVAAPWLPKWTRMDPRLGALVAVISTGLTCSYLIWQIPRWWAT